MQLVHQVRADPQQLSATARPRLVPPTGFAWTTLTGDHVRQLAEGAAVQQVLQALTERIETLDIARPSD